MRWVSTGLALLLAAATATTWSSELSISLDVLQRAYHAARPTLSLPVPGGAVQRFVFERTQFLDPASTLKIRTFAGRAVESPSTSANIVITPNSLSAQIFTESGTYYFNSEVTADGVVVARARESTRAEVEYQCLTDVGGQQLRAASVESAQAVKNVLRKFRLAPAATAEFTQFHGSKEKAVLEVVTAINRASGIFHRELGISFQLVPEFERMVFDDPATDPYTSNDPSERLLHEAQDAFDEIIGTENYDVGILLTKGLYGLAYFSSVCDPAIKGSSCIGLPEPVGDAFHVNLVTHELGHQFGAKHTFNSPLGLCTERRDGWTSFEPGTGSTIMSYASLPCEGDSFQPRHDEYFHSESIKQILDFVKSASASCAQVTQGTNSAPEVNAGPEYTIPTGTPFELSASATDAENDTIYYTWEQRDLGPARALTQPDDGLGPLFRSFSPSTNASRIFPRLELILASTNAPEEMLPTKARTMRFRVVARDSQKNGATDWSDTQLQVIDTGAPFKITSHNSTQLLSNTTVVEWDVAGTTNAPISAANVRLTLSTNGGRSFDIVLADSTANDGSEEVTVPALASSNVRIKVQPTDNIFFDINDASLAISEPPPIGLRLNANRASDGRFQVSWDARAGTVYSLERSENLARNLWREVVRTNAAGTNIQVNLPATNSHSFYRVVLP